MAGDGVVEVLVKDDVAAAVAPAAHIHRNADGGGVTGGILNVHAHDGVLAAHALGADADGVDAVFQELFHLGGALILVVGADGAHESLLGEKGRGLNGSGDTHANQKRRTGVQAVAGHAVKDKLGHALVAFAGHQDSSVAGECAAAARHVSVDLTAVPVGDDVPPHSGGALADILAGIVLIEGLHRVVAQRGLEGGLYDRVLEKAFQLIDEGEAGAALHPELQNAGVLAGGAVKLDGQLLVAEHGVIDHLGQGFGLFFAQLLELCDHVIRELLAGVADELCHHVGHFLDLSFFVHSNSSYVICSVNVLSGIERESDGQDDHAHDESDDDQGQAGFHVIHELVVAGTNDHGVGRHADRGRVSAGAADHAGHQNSAGVSAHALGNGEADGSHQRGGRGVGHEVCHHAAEEQHHEGQQIRGGVCAQHADHLVGDKLACAGGLQGGGEGEGTTEEEDCLEVD